MVVPCRLASISSPILESQTPHLDKNKHHPPIPPNLIPL